ncbi:MAG: amidohydrolase [Actinomycetota bacterium]
MTTAMADLLFVNGAVYTVDARRSRATTVAVRGGRILAVGGDEVRELAGDATEVVDLRGRMLLPGFQDAHAHPPSAGLEMLRCNLSDAYALEEYEGLIDAYATAHPDEAWILGGGWSMDVFPGGNPPRDVLDRLVPDRPVFLPSRDGHSAWVNSRALAIGGVTAATPDPADGVIVHGPDGEPWGTLHEGALRLVEDHAPKETTEDWLAGLRVGQAFLHALGVTAWQDAIVGLATSYRTLDAYVRFAHDGELTARVVGALWWDRYRGREQLAELVAARERGRAGRFAPTSVKIMQDGVIENFTAGLLEPYLDADGVPTANLGRSFVDPEELKGHVTALDAAGFQVHFHAIGERAVREALDAIEAARAANGPNDLRHHIAHLQVVHPDDLPRFRELGVVANGQPLWAQGEGQMVNLTIPFLGPERATWQYPFGSLARAGARLAFGSDWSVSSPNPLEEMHVAVNRTGFPDYPYAGGAETTEPFLPDEAVDLPTAIAAFTIGSAYVNHLDDVTGSIEAGKEADLVVLDRDLFEHPAEEIAAARVQLTLVGGERVFAADDFS